MWKHISPFVLAAATGLAFLAYNQHDFYAYVSRALTLLMMVISIGFTAWHAALIAARVQLSKGIASYEERDRIRKVLDGLEVPFLFVVVYLTIMAYVWLLELLPTPVK